MQAGGYTRRDQKINLHPRGGGGTSVWHRFRAIVREESINKILSVSRLALSPSLSLSLCIPPRLFQRVNRGPRNVNRINRTLSILDRTHEPAATEFFVPLWFFASLERTLAHSAIFLQIWEFYTEWNYIISTN